MIETPRQCHLGDVIGEPLLPSRAIPWTKPRRSGRLERIVQAMVTGAGIVVYLALGLAFLLAAFMVPVRAAEYPLSIPSACVDLAIRHHEPLTMQNRRQALKTKAKLWALSARELGVVECRAAVQRLEEMDKNP